MARILIAEDDSAIRVLLATVLQRHGFEVETATDGAETLHLIAEHTIDVLLLDLMMPVLSGWNVLEELERLQHPLTRRMLIVTAASDKELEPLHDKYPLLRKPFDLAELLAIVGRMHPASGTLITPQSSAAAGA